MKSAENNQKLPEYRTDAFGNRIEGEMRTREIPYKILFVRSNSDIEYKFKTLYVKIENGVLTYSGKDEEGNDVSGAIKEWSTYEVYNSRFKYEEKHWVPYLGQVHQKPKGYWPNGF